jgi:hypothetical protein
MARSGRLGCAMVGLALALAGCAAVERHDVGQKEQLLAAAGFEMKPADTPVKLADLQRLPQQKLVRHERDGAAVWVYADATDCKCLYSGDQANYDELEKLRVQQKIADQEEMAAAMNQQSEMDWEMWGPW